MQASQKEAHYGFGGNSQVRGGAEFRALREYMGLSVEDFARVTCASVSKVVAWEGLSGHIPGKVWRLVDEAVDVFDNLVDDLADVEVADWRPGGENRPIPLPYFRSQEKYQACCDARGFEPFEGCDFGVDGVARSVFATPLRAKRRTAFVRRGVRLLWGMFRMTAPQRC